MFGMIVIVAICFCMISILWFTLKTGISPMPSSLQARLAILKACEQVDDKRVVVDLGSGWGTLLVALARKYPERQLIGYEVSWLPWFYSQLIRIMFRMQNVKIYRSNFLQADLPASALLVCYLHPGGMQDLQQKLLDECVANTMLISSTFALPDIQVDQLIKLDDLYQTPVYVYQLKQQHIDIVED